ncbi:hypothetical protein NPIL_338131 [Nephila pilipes]|uniref:Uncharacterized protein n=1 Tax=Nephila pilipes TaxID=299642 RepID=A0A8X6PZT3_NEPPI|nr:hypothetical protein NPIL_338131 [Nephila pilipes]
MPSSVEEVSIQNDVFTERKNTQPIDSTISGCHDKKRFAYYFKSSPSEIRDTGSDPERRVGRCGRISLLYKISYQDSRTL